MQKLKIRLTFTEEILGTASGNPDIHGEFIASKAPDAKTVEEEIAAIGVDAKVEKSKTVFPRQDGKPFLYDYQIKGFFKEACGALARLSDSRSAKIKAYRKVICGLIFVAPRQIPFCFDGKIGRCQRPLSAQTLQGPRVALADSETIAAGASIEFEVLLMDERHDPLVKEWLDYGQFLGIGQWRGSGKGRFTWQEI